LCVRLGSIKVFLQIGQEEEWMPVEGVRSTGRHTKSVVFSRGSGVSLFTNQLEQGQVGGFVFLDCMVPLVLVVARCGLMRSVVTGSSEVGVGQIRFWLDTPWFPAPAPPVVLEQIPGDLSSPGWGLDPIGLNSVKHLQMFGFMVERERMRVAGIRCLRPLLPVAGRYVAAARSLNFQFWRFVLLVGADPQEVVLYDWGSQLVTEQLLEAGRQGWPFNGAT
jgi:hypothetical protein